MILSRRLAGGFFKCAGLPGISGAHWRLGAWRVKRSFSDGKGQPQEDLTESKKLSEEKPKDVGEDTAGDTSGGYVFKKKPEIVLDFDKLDQSQMREHIATRNLRFSNYYVMSPVLPISSIVASRRSFYIVLGIFLSIATVFYYTGHPYICFFFCFLATSPLTYIRQSKRVLSNKILQVKLHADMKTVDLTTAYKSMTVRIGDIKPGKHAVENLGKARQSFEDFKLNDFKMPDGPMALGLPLFVKVPCEGKQMELVIDLDHVLFRIDNFDIFADIMTGNEDIVNDYRLIDDDK